MCINPYENLSDIEKTELLKDYVDYLYIWESKHDELFQKFDSNNILKRKFLKVVVPIWFDSINLDKLFYDNLSLLNLVYDNMQKVAFDFPLFYLQCAVTGAIDCYWESLNLKKIISRWSQILLSIC